MLSSRLHRQLMTRLRKDRKPTFLWQGLLILLPVAALALVGLSAIIRDRAAVQQDARQRAQEILAQMSDGAAAAIVMSAERAQQLGLKPLGRYVAYATAGYKPYFSRGNPVADDLK